MNLINNIEFDVAIFEIDQQKQMVNLTKIAKHFDKNVNDWYKTKSTQEFLTEMQLESETNIIVSVKGNFSDGMEQGTWCTQEVALEFAQWISPKFKVYCICHLKRLFNTGATSISKPLDPMQQLAASLVLAHQILDAKDKQIATLTPKVEYFDEVLQSETVYDVNEIAKELGTSAVTLNKRLNELGVQYKSHDIWLLYAKYQNKGYTKTTTEVRKYGQKVVTTMRTVWTEAGRRFIHTIFNSKMSENTYNVIRVSTQALQLG